MGNAPRRHGERAECCICHATTGMIRYELFRIEIDGELKYDAGDRCADRDRCRADVLAIASSWDPADGPAPVWNVIDGPVAVRKPKTSWHARAGSTAPEPPEIPPLTEPATEQPSRPATTGEQVGYW